MDIQRCFEVLELDAKASPTEVKQAYKDMVNVWHPDRFPNNPRLKQKAEMKLKEINAAYEVLGTFLSTRESARWREERVRHAQAGARRRGSGEARADEHARGAGGDNGTATKTEVAVEVGTFIFLSVCSYCYSALRSFINTHAAEVEREAMKSSEHAE